MTYSHGRKLPLAGIFVVSGGCSGSSTYCRFLPSLRITGMCFDRILFPVIPHHADELIKDDTLVIHIRSGDVFWEDLTKLHKGYIQPPLSFYLEIINKFKFKDIVIVTQDDFKNPCINELKRLMPDIRIQTSNLLDDISIISARNLVIAHSSFSLCLGLASDKLKRMFIPQFDITNKFYYTRAPFWPNIYKYSFVSKTNFTFS